MSNRVLAAGVVGVWLWLSAAPRAAELYVAPNGDDANPGTRERPLATPAGARDAIRRLGLAGREPVTVWFRAGVYYLPRPLELTARDSGGLEAPITYAALEGERVVWSGARPLSRLRWTLHGGSVWRARVEPEQLEPLERFDGLVVNGRLQHAARYPNYDPEAPYFNGVAADATAPSRVARWSRPAGGYVFAMHPNMWGDMAFVIRGKTADNQLLLEGGWQNNRPKPPHRERRFVENIFEELDAPGEWYYDADKHWLYYWPPDGVRLEEAACEAVGLRRLVSLKGTADRPVTDIRFRGLVFRHTLRTFMDTREPLLRSDWRIYRGGAVELEGTRRCGLFACDLEWLGGNAVFFSGYNRRGEVRGCWIREVGASGVCFVGDPRAVRSPCFQVGQTLSWDELDKTPGPKTDDYPADCLVDDCLIARTGRVEKQTAPVQIAMSARITVRHCSIYDVPRAGINIGDGCWGGHVIEWCDVFDTVKETGDHGSFNSWGRDRFWHLEGVDEDQLGVGRFAELPKWDARETTVLRNNRWRCDHGWDIDLDDGSSNYHIYNNLCLRGGIKNREGFFRVVENNVIINNGFHPHVWYRHSQDVFRRNIVCRPYRPARMFSDGPWGAEMDYNLLHSTTVSGPAVVLQQASGRDAHSRCGDARFRDPAGDYTLREDSPALRLGIVPFPMTGFGVVSPRLRRAAETPILPLVAPWSGEERSRTAALRWLGARLKPLEGPEDRSAVGLGPDAEGLLVLDVDQDGPARRWGLQPGDVILQVGARPVRSAGDLPARLPRDAVSLVVWRDQRSVTLTAAPRRPR